MTPRFAALAAIVLLGTCGPPPGASAAAPRPVVPPGQVQAITLDGATRQGGAVLGIAPAGTRSLSLDGTPVPVARDGRFLIAFDRDAAAAALLVATLGDGRQVTRALVVSPGDWSIERVDAPLGAGRTSEEIARLRPVELARIAAARAIESNVDGWRQRFVWPVIGRRSGQFGSQRVYQGVPGSYHGGTDVAVGAGTPVRAPADGVVVLAAAHPFTLEGNLVILDHGMGLTSAFLHFSRVLVAPGQRVRQGEVIGLAGATGRATGPHMHWGMVWRGRRIDPALLAGAMTR